MKSMKFLVLKLIGYTILQISLCLHVICLTAVIMVVNVWLDEVCQHDT